MNRLRLSWLDIFIIACGTILLTGGEWLFTGSALDHVRLHPSHHRLVLSAVTILLLSVIFHKHYRNRLYAESLIFSTIKKLSPKPLHCVTIVFLTMALVFSYSSYIRHHVFHTSFDFAIFAQAVWNTWHGNFLYSSIKGGICLLGDHVSPILAFFAPMYGFSDSAVSLLILQAIFASSAVFPIYLIGKRVLSNAKLAVMFAGLYALYLPLRNAVRFDFHPEVAADPLILWGFYFLLVGRLWPSSIFLFLTLMTKETACAPVAAVAFYTFCFQKRYGFGILWILMAVGVFLIDVYIIAPYFSGKPYFYFGFYSSGLMTSIKQLFQGSTLTYLKKIFLPLGFFSFLSPSVFLLTVPILVQNLATGANFQRSIFFQYTAFLTPFVFVSAIFGLMNFLNWLQKHHPGRLSKWKRFATYWIIGWSFLLSGVSEYHVISEYQRLDSPHLEYVRRYLKTIPSDFSVRTHEFFAPHLANRKELHIYENQHPKEGGSEKAQNADLVIIDNGFLRSSPSKETQVQQLKAKGYKIIHKHDGFYVFSRLP